MTPTCHATVTGRVENAADNSLRVPGEPLTSGFPLSDRDSPRHMALERPLFQSVDVWSSHVLGTESDPDHPRRDSA